MKKTGQFITDIENSLFNRILNFRDIQDVSNETEIKVITLKSIILKNEKITTDNYAGYNGLLRKCLQKIEESLTFFEKAKSELSEMLPKVS